jgi:hypothetical protein
MLPPILQVHVMQRVCQGLPVSPDILPPAGLEWLQTAAQMACVPDQQVGPKAECSSQVHDPPVSGKAPAQELENWSPGVVHTLQCCWFVLL